uniref:Multidrug resistance-associated protein 1 n=1 Tax=Ditylenchus dipsaci TaxID=166011 RepID=A0A915EWI1_9BILA
MTMIGLLINQTVQALVSNKRLKEFLVAEEISDNAIDRTPETGGSLEAISVRDADFSWGAGTLETEPTDTDSRSTATIQDIQLEVRRGTLLAVVGKVGSGKSSLLSALLGEMDKLRGYVGVRGQVAYVPQTAWIRNMSLRDNIVFGKPFDRKYYDKVLDVCALTPDLATLPLGDDTEIGEKGINLSGGQKARVSLARAVYQNYDVYLLDDPLSAVDSHVGKHIFEKVIGPNGILRNKTRILVTHGISFLKEADRIVLLENGRITESGTYTELLAHKNKFSELVEEDKGDTSSPKEELADEDPKSPLNYEDDDFAEYDESAMSIFGAEAAIDIEMPANIERQMSTASDALQASQNDRTRSSVSPRRLTSQTLENTAAKAATDKFNKDKLIQKEHVETGRVKRTVYLDYVTAAGYFLSSVFFLLYCSFQVLQLGRSVWLSKWADDNVESGNQTHTSTSIGVRLGVYALFGIGEAVSYYIALIALLFGGIAASKNLHSPVLQRIMQAPMSFFDTTPLGRILNRFGKDIEVVDSVLAINFRYFIMCLTQIVATLFIITVTTPVFVVVIVPLALLYYVSLKFYVPTSRQLKRLESINRSPIYSHFGETIQGSSSIRAFGKTDEFCLEIEGRVDRFLRIKYLSLVANRWLAVRLEFVGNCVVLFAALFAALSNEGGLISSAGLVGLSVSYALNITEVLNFAVRQRLRLRHPGMSKEKPPKDWPQAGAIEFVDYSTRYRPGLELVVKNISAQIHPCEKIGIVGRTGAGKSSLTLALFRMIEPADGKILIDGLDIRYLGLHDLRSNLTIIPQEPVLFSGTMRFNLDPFNRHSDDEIWRVLELAHLKEFARALPDGLAHNISEGGDNISLGQRQLVCLARALLRRTKILVLDEATAAVDMYTDSLIQETIRREFQHSTVFTIAHRLNTIIDYNRVMVLDKGEIKELDSPDALLNNTESLFSAMAIDAKLGSKRE